MREDLLTYQDSRRLTAVATGRTAELVYRRAVSALTREEVRRGQEGRGGESANRYEIQRRHVFHFDLTAPTPPRWASAEEHDGEQEPTRFECFWIPLHAAHILQAGQGALLGRLFDQH